MIDNKNKINEKIDNNKKKYNKYLLKIINFLIFFVI